MNSPTKPTVLIVDDERALAEAYRQFLEPDYDVRVANSGEAALEQLDAEPDVVLLDRRMPGMSGDRVLEIMQNRRLDARIAMVTAVDPDFDVIDMGIDDYLVKPIDRATIRETVERLLALNKLEEKNVELSSKQLKRNLLEVEKSPEDLAESEAFDRLETEIAELEYRIEHLESDVSGGHTPLQRVA
jgi:DNA-binding response OmpR family regulator